MEAVPTVCDTEVDLAPTLDLSKETSPVTRFIYLAPTILFLFSATACSGEDDSGGRIRGEGNGTGTGSSGNGSGTGSTNGGIDPGIDPGGGGGDDCGSVLPVVFRDFKGSGEPGGHPDFELSATKTHEGTPFEGWNDLGCEMVELNIGPGDKPVFYSGVIDKNDGVNIAPGSGRRQRVVTGPDCWSETNQNPNPAGTCYVGACQTWVFSGPSNGTYGEIGSAATFGQWYTDVPDVNVNVPGELPLTETPEGSGIYVYDNSAFFPIDGQGWGNTPGQSHNYHFTTEIHVEFKYQAGQKFTFRGDDDLWIFVNGKLALDVGGLHQALTGTIDFDLQAADLGITPGGVYRMDIFHAERQTAASNFRIETNISCFEPVDVR